MVRKILELGSRRFSFKRSLPRSFGGCKFYASLEGGLKYWRGDLAKIDPALLNAAKSTVTRGDVVWDIGANVGLFSFAAAGLAGPDGQVYSVEPDTFLVGLLRRSAALPNVAALVRVIPLAVADNVALAEFHIAARARASNSLANHGATQTGGVRERQTVMIVTLDWLATQIPPPAVIKIDAEGAEVRILAGGRELLRRHKPKLICEVAGENSVEVSRILSDCGYQIFDGERPLNSQKPAELAPWATLAFPRAV